LEYIGARADIKHAPSSSHSLQTADAFVCAYVANMNQQHQHTGANPHRFKKAIKPGVAQCATHIKSTEGVISPYLQLFTVPVPSLRRPTETERLSVGRRPCTMPPTPTTKQR
jgi:hypothetical protein